MKIVTCPRCRQTTLMFTGAFWMCESCGLTITSTALLVDCPELRTTALRRRG